MDIGLKEEEKPVEQNQEINLDFRTPVVGQDLSSNDYDLFDENEVVEHENREDVISEIYQSKDVMEEHVFPYLRSLIG